MIRIVIENLLLFLLPTLAYVGWILIARPETVQRDENGRVRPFRILDDAPFLWLVGSGALVLVLVLVAFGQTSGGLPGQKYQPPVFKDGHIEPGHID
jgi:hypothetical protein